MQNDSFFFRAGREDSQQPCRADLYPDIFDKAAQLCYSLIKNHPFLDGNKRIGVHLTLLFLHLNGEALRFSQDELSEFGLAVGSGTIGRGEIKEWRIRHRN